MKLSTTSLLHLSLWVSSGTCSCWIVSNPSSISVTVRNLQQRNDRTPPWMAHSQRSAAKHGNEHNSKRHSATVSSSSRSRSGGVSRRTLFKPTIVPRPHKDPLQEVTSLSVVIAAAAALLMVDGQTVAYAAVADDDDDPLAAFGKSLSASSGDTFSKWSVPTSSASTLPGGGSGAATTSTTAGSLPGSSSALNSSNHPIEGGPTKASSSSSSSLQEVLNDASKKKNIDPRTHG